MQQGQQGQVEISGRRNSENYDAVAAQLKTVPMSEMHALASETEQKLIRFVAMLNEKLTSADVPAILADVYFTQATQTMDVVSQLFANRSNKKLRQIEHAVRYALSDLRMLFWYLILSPRSLHQCQCDVSVTVYKYVRQRYHATTRLRPCSTNRCHAIVLIAQGIDL